MAATTEEVPRPYGRGTSSVVSFVVAMNRVDVVDLVVDLVDVNLDIDLVDVDLDVDLVDVDHVDIPFVVLLMLPCGRPRAIFPEHFSRKKNYFSIFFKSS